MSWLDWFRKAKPNDPEAWVVLNAYYNPIEAHLDRGRLESLGFECILTDENIVTIQALYAPAVGGIKLKVRRKAYVEAHNILFSK